MNIKTLCIAGALLIPASGQLASAQNAALTSIATPSRAAAFWREVRDNSAYLDGLIAQKKLGEIHAAAFNLRDSVRMMRGAKTDLSISAQGALLQNIERVDTLANSLDVSGDKNDLRNTVANARRMHLALDAIATLFGTQTLAPVGPLTVSGMVKDPVCRMTVDPATSPGRAAYQGQTYYFCSVGDAKTFDKAPAKYAALYDEVTFGAPNTYVISLSAQSRAHAGRPEPLSFAVRENGGKEVMRKFQLVHEKMMHLIVVSDDLSYFSHEHPELGSDGRFRLAPTFPYAGRYFLFSDFTPADGLNQILRTQITVDGAKPKSLPKLVADTTLSKVVDGATVSLALSAPLVVGKTSLLTYSFARDGKPLTDLQPYLGAMGHLMAINGNGQEAVHTHTVGAGGPVSEDMATANGPRFTFALVPRAAGLTRVWAQFQRQGKVLTVPFTFNVAQNPEAIAYAKKVPTSNKAKTQTIHVVIDNAYQPASVQVVAGVPTTLSFTLKHDSGCGNTVVIPSLGKTLALRVGQTMSVSFTPTKNQTLAFACPMKMFQGQIVAR